LAFEAASREAGRLTDVPGIKVGHAQDSEGITGCTVVLCEGGFTAAGDVRGGGPGTRETDLLHPDVLVQEAHAVLLGGGSAFGLAAAEGVMAHLRERGVGIDTHVARVPIVPAAVMFDLPIGRPDAYPTPTMGRKAAEEAGRTDFEEGSVGAGMGATVGKFAGLGLATKSGLGTASVRVGNLVVGAVAAVNAYGQVVDEDGSVLAGARSSGGGWLDVREVLRSDPPEARPIENTSLAVVGTNARLTKAQVKRVAMMAQDGLARSIFPVHTLFDGDSVFALASGDVQTEPSIVGAWAADAVAEAVRRAVFLAEGAGGIPAIREL
jgi:L-aminopeptidase/D-esterase-like protein